MKLNNGYTATQMLLYLNMKKLRKNSKIFSNQSWLNYIKDKDKECQVKDSLEDLDKDSLEVLDKDSLEVLDKDSLEDQNQPKFQIWTEIINNN
jgi:hypothetical protein